MILSNDEIMVINQTAEFDSAIGYARAIEAKVLEKLEGKLRDAERYRFIRDAKEYSEGLAAAFYLLERWESAPSDIDQAIDAAIKESK